MQPPGACENAGKLEPSEFSRVVRYTAVILHGHELLFNADGHQQGAPTVQSAVFLIAAVAAVGQPEPAREWTTASGLTFQAELIDIEDNRVRLQLKDGPIDIPRDLLSPTDQKFIVSERNRREREAQELQAWLESAVREAVAPEILKFADRLEAQAKAGRARMQRYRETVAMYRGFQAHVVYGRLQAVQNRTHTVDRMYDRLKLSANVLRAKDDITSEWLSNWTKSVELLLSDIQLEEAAIARELNNVRMVPRDRNLSPYKPNWGRGITSR